VEEGDRADACEVALDITKASRALMTRCKPRSDEPGISALTPQNSIPQHTDLLDFEFDNVT
jgi:hypothetical protein